MTDLEAKAWFDLLGQCDIIIENARAALLLGDPERFKREIAALSELTHRGATLKIGVDAGVISVSKS